MNVSSQPNTIVSFISAPVVPYVRLVPGGIVDTKDGLRLRVSAVFTPERVEGQSDTGFDLRNWVGNLAAALKSDAEGDGTWTMAIEACVVTTNGDKLAKVADHVPVPFGVARAHDFQKTFKGGTATAIGGLWRKTIETDDARANLWLNLSKALSTSLDGTKVQPGDIDTPEASGDYKQPKFGNAGQLDGREDGDGTPENETIDSVLSVPHADLAVFLDRERSRETFCSICQSSGQHGAVAEAEKARCALIKNNSASATEFPDSMSAEKIKTIIEAQKGPESQKLIKDRIKFNAVMRKMLKPGKNPNKLILGVLRKTGHTKFKDGFILQKKTAILSSQILKDEKRLKHLEMYARLKTQREAAKVAYNIAKDALCDRGAYVWQKPTPPKTVKAFDDAQFGDACDAYCYSTWEQYKDAPAPASVSGDSEAMRGYFAIQSSPTVARLFGLIVDLEVELDTAFLTNAFQDKDEAFLLLSCGMHGAVCGKTATRARPWTLCKLARPQAGVNPDYFWPADIGEIDIADDATVFSRDGYVAMGLGWDPENMDRHAPRFDLSSIDARGGTEMEMQRRDNRAEAVRRDKTDETLQDLAQSHTLQTRGMSLLDKNALQGTVRKLAAMKTKAEGDKAAGECIEARADGPPDVVLEASDLTIGQRLDVGSPTAKDGNGRVTTQWRPLLNRIVKYKRASDRTNTEAVIRALLGKGNDTRRRMLESPPLTNASRLLPRGTGVGLSEAVVEQSVALWDGSPMGVYTGPAAKGPEPKDVLPFKKRLAAPNKDHDPRAPRPPQLRYGWGYRFAMRHVFLGGLSVPVTDERITERLDRTGMIYPGEAGTPLPFQRFLRQERVDAPLVLLGYKHALKQHGRMGFEQGPRMVIRSARLPEGALEIQQDIKSRARPDQAQRLIVVPSIAQDEAARYGWLDAQKDIEKPTGCYGWLKTHHRPSEFPVVQTKTALGFDQSPYLVDRDVIRPPKKGSSATQSDHLNDAVAQARSSSDKQDSFYYADPAASFMAVALRRKGFDTYLGQAIKFDLSPAKAGVYPEPLPVVLTLSKAKPRTSPIRDINELTVTLARTDVDLDRSGDIRKSGSSKRALGIELALAPGEEFELDMWFVPSPKDLARKFAITESLATFATREAGTSAKFDIAGLVTKIEQVLPKDLAADFATLVDQIENPSDGFVAPEGIIGPSPAVLNALASCLHDLMARAPVPEIAAITRIDLVHAVNRPAKAPVMAVPDNNFASDLMKPPVEGVWPMMALRPSDLSKDLKTRELHFDPGSNGFVLHGEVELDLNDTDVLEIVGQLAMPPAGVFDNSRQHRSLLKKRHGEWPEIVDADGETQLRDPRDVFGFEVDRNTQLTKHDRSEQVLLRIDDLRLDRNVQMPIRFNVAEFFKAPVPEDLDKNANSKAATTRIDVKFAIKDADGAYVILSGRTTHQMAMGDAKARIMSIRARGLSRTAGLFDTINTVTNGSFEQSEPLPGVAQFTTGDRMQLILPSTRRPAKPDVLTPHPVFKHTTDLKPATSVKQTRTALVRVRFGRGWFSAGRGEKIGLILWPPNIIGDDTSGLGDNLVPIATRDKDGKVGRRFATLDKFTDDDLGPGGKFVTRMGADPVRESTRDKGHFLTLKDFEDRVGDDGKYIGNCLMPLDDETRPDGAPLNSLAVGLLTYEPRFDLEQETWYADIQINSKQATDPFLRLGLVRYQPHTDQKFQLSNPVTQWIQLLPKRDVEVTQSSSEGLLDVEVVGQASRGAKPVSYTKPDVHDPYARPMMRAVLTREEKLPSEQGHRETLEIGPDKGAYALLVTADDKNDKTTWKWQVPRPDRSADTPFTSYVLYIEEIERRRPATYPVEPVSVEQLREDDVFISSGPRYAARIDLTDILGPAPDVPFPTQGK
jgi:hypothetical protein